MSEDDSLQAESLRRLKAQLPIGRVFTDDAIPARNQGDASRLPAVKPLAVVMPRSAEELATAVQVCFELGQPVVTQGGLTGMVGGGMPGPNEIAISLEKMSGITEIDPICATVTAYAGTPLYLVQDAVAEIGMTLGIDLGARGSCTVGGIIATNAGGHQVVRYGMTRRHVMGLEVVLPDGTIVSSLGKIVKDNAGYDWKQLMIGSEGTLGIVTKAVLSMEPPTRDIVCAMLGFNNTQDAIAVLRRLQARFPSGLLAFEAMWSEFCETAARREAKFSPLSETCDVTVLVDVDASIASASDFKSFLEAIYEQELLADAVVAKSQAERTTFWAFRECLYEFSKKMPPGPIFDVSIPADKMETAVTLLRDRIPKLGNEIEWVIFGHLGDNNLHIRLGSATNGETVAENAKQTVYEIVAKLKGSISAEHGIGILKRGYLAHTRSPEEIALMRVIKAAIDPKNILNRGRLLPC